MFVFFNEKFKAWYIVVLAFVFKSLLLLSLGDPIFERTAFRAAQAVWVRRSTIGLVSGLINGCG